jgi:hypothetical protein
MPLALLALALPTAVLAATIPFNFEVAPDQITGGAPQFVGISLQQSSAFNLGGGPYVVTGIGMADESGLSRGDTVTLAPTLFSYGSADSGSTALVMLWSGSHGSFDATFTSFTADRSSSNALTLDLFGTLEGPQGINEPITAILSANQAGGTGWLVGWTLTQTATIGVGVPEPGTLGLLELGLLGIGVLGLPGLARRKLKLGT